MIYWWWIPNSNTWWLNKYSQTTCSVNQCKSILITTSKDHRTIQTKACMVDQCQWWTVDLNLVLQTHRLTSTLSKSAQRKETQFSSINDWRRITTLINQTLLLRMKLIKSIWTRSLAVKISETLSWWRTSQTSTTSLKCLRKSTRIIMENMISSTCLSISPARLMSVTSS